MTGSITSLAGESSNSWAIGIYAGGSPFHLRPSSEVDNPVLSCQDVSDIPASFIADPFMIRANETWYMFFEVMNRQRGKGQIGLATSKTGLDWAYQQIVLDEPFHLSYPCVFACGGEYYMIPETLQPGSIRLYRASAFPDRWAFAGTLLNTAGADPSVFHFAGKWWMFVCQFPGQNDTLRLYAASELMGPWVEHPKSPVIKGNIHRARPAGRVVVFAGRVIRYAQDCYPRYGTQVRAFEITELTPATYLEKEDHNSPILTPTSSAWNRIGMHHVDPHPTPEGQWIACVDGRGWTQASPSQL